MLEHHIEQAGLGPIARKLSRGLRLDRQDGLTLFACEDIAALGALAHARRLALHGPKTFFVTNRHVNYTNVCVNSCAFCAYQCEAGSDRAFTLGAADVLAKLHALPRPPRELHVVGGCHPELRLSYFEDMLSQVRAQFPGTTLKCFTAVEIAHFARLEDLGTAEVLTRLKQAGLAMLPGGGAEIFEPEVRRRICPNKITGREWLRIHGEAHGLGLPTNCTMLFGHLETREHRVDHMLDLREQQDRSGGFQCFIPLPFLPENNALRIKRPLDGLEELRTIAVSRLMLDNIPHIKAYWVMLTTKQAQLALHFGADDFDGTVVEEKIGHTAGATSEQGLTLREIEDMILGCGLAPVERDAFFREVAA